MNANRQLPKHLICKQRMCVQLSNGETQLSNEDPRPGKQQTPPSSQAPSMTYFQQLRPMANGAPLSHQLFICQHNYRGKENNVSDQIIHSEICLKNDA
jgi:hypothetical protein